MQSLSPLRTNVFFYLCLFYAFNVCKLIFCNTKQLNWYQGWENAACQVKGLLYNVSFIFQYIDEEIEKYVISGQSSYLK